MLISKEMCPVSEPVKRIYRKAKRVRILKVVSIIIFALSIICVMVFGVNIVCYQEQNNFNQEIIYSVYMIISIIVAFIIFWFILVFCDWDYFFTNKTLNQCLIYFSKEDSKKRMNKEMKWLI